MFVGWNVVRDRAARTRRAPWPRALYRRRPTADQLTRERMIGRIAGTLLEKHPPALVVDVAGVGYELEVPMSTYYALPKVGEGVALLVHMVVREDAMLLFGFGSALERSLFRALLRVNGVGAKMALSILSGLSPDEFLSCVARKDVPTLVRVPGVGKKTAERLLVELQDKVDGIGGAALAGGQSSGGLLGAEPTMREQAEEALAALGYRPIEIKRLLDKHADDAESVEAMIRAALRGARV